MGKVFNVKKRKSHYKNNKHNKYVKYKPLALAIAVAFAGTLPNVAKAATYTVNSIADSGLGSLREAVASANATANTPDSIVFGSNISPGTQINLITEISITDTLTITGPTVGDANSIILDGINNSRHFEANFATTSGKTITLENMTLRNGAVTNAANLEGGGSIFVQNADLTINHGKIINNTVSGTYGSGGGIYAKSAHVNLNQTTVSGNSTTVTGSAQGYGGGIAVSQGSITINQSTIADNSSVFLGGGISGVAADSNITQSTISGNIAIGGGGAIFNSYGSVDLFQSTITNNSSTSGAGGLSVALSQAAYDVTLSNTILSGNTTTGSGSEGNFHNRFAGGNGVLNVDYSLFGDPVTEITGTYNNNNIVFSDNPDIGPLLDNGGPTFTHLPNVGGNAVDAGNNSAISGIIDQRGTSFNRIINNTTDIGAVELQTTTPSVVSNNNDSGAGSLRQAVLYANYSSTTESITFDNGLANQTIYLQSEIEITEPLTISGPTPNDADSLILDGGENNRHIYANGSDLTLENITLQNGLYDGTTTYGLGDGGGAVFVKNADLNINHGKINNNSSKGQDIPGGGIYVLNGNVSLHHAIISSNSTTDDNSSGGGLFVKNGNVSLHHSIISSNSTYGGFSPGGGLSVKSGNLSLIKSTISANETKEYNAEGGGFYLFNGNISLNQSTVSANSTKGFFSYGGGFSVRYGNITLDQTTVSANSTGGYYSDGGAFFVRNGNINLNQSTVTNNTTGTETAGIYLRLYSPVGSLTYTANLNNSILSNNTRNQEASNLEIVTITAGLDASINLNINLENNLLGTDVIPVINDETNSTLVTNTANITNDNPGLGPLQNNGGSTLTHLPNEDSPVLNKGSNTIANEAGFINDQRGVGFNRIQDGLVDIGAVELPTFSYDIDGNGQVAALSDGLLVLRYLFGFREGALIAGAIGNSASRTTATEIEAYIQQGVTNGDLDIDGNNEVTALTDGLLLLRYQFGFRGDSLIQGAIGNNAVRDTAETIESFLN